MRPESLPFMPPTGAFPLVFEESSIALFILSNVARWCLLRSLSEECGSKVVCDSEVNR